MKIVLNPVEPLVNECGQCDTQCSSYCGFKCYCGSSW
jgi:hypothetical protein